MPRPRKWKKVCSLPEFNEFGPIEAARSDKQVICMSIEAYETIRLIDLNGYTQEECAVQMQIARGTVQSLYKEARYKIADALINGHALRIQGGDFELYEDGDDNAHMGCGQCNRNRCGRRNQGRKGQF